jgi:hypothetical protein
VEIADTGRGVWAWLEMDAIKGIRPDTTVLLVNAEFSRRVNAQPLQGPYVSLVSQDVNDQFGLSLLSVVQGTGM